MFDCNDVRNCCVSCIVIGIQIFARISRYKTRAFDSIVRLLSFDHLTDVRQLQSREKRRHLNVWNTFLNVKVIND